MGFFLKESQTCVPWISLENIAGKSCRPRIGEAKIHLMKAIFLRYAQDNNNSNLWDVQEKKMAVLKGVIFEEEAEHGYSTMNDDD